MTSKPAWISSREAAKQLEVKLSTLYAYTSRGLVESVPGPHGRGRLYARESIERLKTRHDARAGLTAVAAGALRWGEPTLETSIVEIRSDGPYCRGHSLLALADGSHSFESVCDLLWTGTLKAPEPTDWAVALPQVALPAPPRRPAPLTYMAAALALAALSDEARHGASDAQEHGRARSLILWLAELVGGRSRPDAGSPVEARGASARELRVEARGASARELRVGARGASARELRVGARGASAREQRIGSVAARLLRGFGQRPSARRSAILDRALTLCADHELTASTFAARVTASTGSNLYACLGAGLNALDGPHHGGVAARIEALLREIGRPERTASVVRERLARGERIPGYGHPLYPDGDPRAVAMLALAAESKNHTPRLARLLALNAAMKRAAHPPPNFDIGLVALCCALSLPEGAPAALFAVGRCAGYVAHILEQRQHGYLLRPRARYIGTGDSV